MKYKINYLITVVVSCLISNNYAETKSEPDHIPGQIAHLSRSDAICNQSHQLELSKSIYPIYLSNGGKYKVFDDAQAMGLFILEGKFQNNNLYEYLITMRSKDGSVRLYSDSGDALEIELFKGIDSPIPITLFNLQNFCDAAIPVKVENNAMIMRYPIKVIVPAHQWVSPGSYQCFLDIGVYINEGIEITTKTIQLLIEVECDQKILIKSRKTTGLQSKAILDFGEIYTTTTKQIFLDVQSNTNYQLLAQSMNGSKLILNQNWKRGMQQCSSIPYDCSCNGSKLILQNTPQKIFTGCANKQNNGNCHCFSITLHPDVKQNWEGIYEDEIVFSLQPMY